MNPRLLFSKKDPNFLINFFIRTIHKEAQYHFENRTPGKYKIACKYFINGYLEYPDIYKLIGW